MEVELEQRD
jgi:hypothetical protein